MIMLNLKLLKRKLNSNSLGKINLNLPPLGLSPNYAAAFCLNISTVFKLFY